MQGNNNHICSFQKYSFQCFSYQQAQQMFSNWEATVESTSLSLLLGNFFLTPGDEGIRHHCTFIYQNKGNFLSYQLRVHQLKVVTTGKCPQMHEFLPVCVSTQKPEDFLNYPNQQNQTFGTSCSRLAQELFKCASFLTDQQFPFMVKGDIERGRRELNQKKIFDSL